MTLRTKVMGLCTIIAVVAAALAFREFRSARITAVHSDARLILVTLERFYPPDALEKRWRIFHDAEHEKLWAVLRKNAGDSIDACPDCHAQTGEVRDMWGNRFQIAARRRDDGNSDFLVWSKGPDGVSGTDDDVIAPENRSADVRAILEPEDEKVSEMNGSEKEWKR